MLPRARLQNKVDHQMKKYFQFIEPLQKHFKNIFRNTNRPTDDFLEWYGKEDPSNAVTHKLSTYYLGNKDGTEQDNFLTQITKIGDGEIVSVQIDQELAKDLNVTWPRIRYDQGINQFHINGTLQKKKIILKGGSLKLLIIDPPCNAEIEITNCAIAHLQIREHPAAEPNKFSLTVKRTYIGELHFDGPVKKLDFDGGFLLKINCAVPGGKNLFRGSVWFKNVFFPTNAKKYL